jgi:hypothetical protein
VFAASAEGADERALLTGGLALRSVAGRRQTRCRGVGGAGAECSTDARVSSATRAGGAAAGMDACRSSQGRVPPGAGFAERGERSEAGRSNDGVRAVLLRARTARCFHRM